MIDRLRALITHMGVSQNKFAMTVGVTGPEINKILKGKRNLSEGMLARIIAKTGVNETWLRTGKGEMFAPSKTQETSPFDHAIAQSLSPFAAGLYERYTRLPAEYRDAFEKLLCETVEAARKVGARRATEITIANVYGDNNTTIQKINN